MANLTQLKILEGMDGFLLVDKPVNIPFASVVKTVKRMFGLAKVGHGGSLDAQASGLMVLLIGDANKFTDQVMGGDREYEGTIDTSYVTNTGDSQGERVENAGRGGERKINLAQFKGDVFQTEPKFTAIRREGTAGYEIVDTGDHQQFLGHVYRLELEDNGSAARRFFLKATKNVIPRALALEMGATLVSLRRTKQWKFELKDAVPFDQILNTAPGDFASLVLPIGVALRA